MKRVLLVFDEEEHASLVQLKKQWKAKSWEKFILQMARGHRPKR